MKSISILFLFFLAHSMMSAQATVNISDLQSIDNSHWEGQLTYKDYGSGKLTSIEATQQIKIEGEKIITSTQYTYEPNENNKSTIKLRKNGNYFGKEKVIRNSIENNTRTIVTTYEGRDNNKKATLYITYKFNATEYSVTKEVVPKDGSERFVRNSYNFKRIQN